MCFGSRQAKTACLRDTANQHAIYRTWTSACIWKFQPEGLAEQALEAESLLTYIIVLILVVMGKAISRELDYSSQERLSYPLNPEP